MPDSLDERLVQAKQRLRLKDKLETMFRQAQQVVKDEQSKCSTLQQRLAQEKADVDRLEALSLTGLFYSVLGTKADRLEKERQELVAAKLKHDEAAEALQDAQEAVRRLRLELDPLADSPAEYDRVIEEKERWLAATGDERADRLLELSTQLADLKADCKELKEAIRAGQTALNSLRQVSSDLGSAANWGTWDMFGGGMISTMAKHSKIDSAKAHAREAQRHLRRFQEELADADQRLRVSLDIGGFSKFADYFFDGLIADWVVQSKISAASSACSSTMAQVSSAISKCNQRHVEAEREIESLNARRRELIEQA